MPSSNARDRRSRGNIYWLPSGSARVTVYGGIDQLTGKRIQLRETVKARATQRETEREADKVQTRLINQVNERRSPKTEVTVNVLIDKLLAEGREVWERCHLDRPSGEVIVDTRKAKPPAVPMACASCGCDVLEDGVTSVPIAEGFCPSCRLDCAHADNRGVQAPSAA